MQLPDSFSHLLMTGKGQAAEPLTVNLNLLAAALYTNTFNSRNGQACYHNHAMSILTGQLCIAVADLQEFSSTAGHTLKLCWVDMQEKKSN